MSQIKGPYIQHLCQPCMPYMGYIKRAMYMVHKYLSWKHDVSNDSFDFKLLRPAICKGFHANFKSDDLELNLFPKPFS